MSVRPSLGPSTFIKKWSLEYQKVVITHLCTYLRESSYSSDSSDSSNNSDSSDSSESNDSSDSSDQTIFYTKQLNLPKTYLPTRYGQYYTEC